jgi:hypothetical protein
MIFALFIHSFYIPIYIFVNALLLLQSIMFVSFLLEMVKF